jgi:hypothetical protein
MFMSIPRDVVQPTVRHSSPGGPGHAWRLPPSKDKDLQFTPLEQAEVVRLARGFSCDESAAETRKSHSSVRARRMRICWKLRRYWKMRDPECTEVLPALVARSLWILGREFAAWARAGSRDASPHHPAHCAFMLEKHTPKTLLKLHQVPAVDLDVAPEVPDFPQPHEPGRFGGVPADELLMHGAAI